MRMVYLIGKILTFPGAYMKGLWEHIFCRCLKIPVEREEYLCMDEGCGHVEHFFPGGRKASFLICFLPSLCNFLLALPIFGVGFFSLIYLGMPTEVNYMLALLQALMLYLGASLLCNIFPMQEDALHMWELIYRGEKKTSLLWKILLFIPAVVLRIGAFLERYSVNVLLMLAFLVVVYLFV